MRFVVTILAFPPPARVSHCGDLLDRNVVGRLGVPVVTHPLDTPDTESWDWSWCDRGYQTSPKQHRLSISALENGNKRGRWPFLLDFSLSSFVPVVTDGLLSCESLVLVCGGVCRRTHKILAGFTIDVFMDAPGWSWCTSTEKTKGSKGLALLRSTNQVAGSVRKGSLNQCSGPRRIPEL